jgi:truncated hemoglobin YjbI
MRTVKRLAPWYVTGFVEGAGSFTFNRGRGRITLVFAVRMREANRDHLERLRSFFGGAGKIYETRRSADDGERVAFLYRINRDRDLLRVIAHFERYPLRGSKDDAFRIWREMVLLRAAHHGGRPPEELNELAARLERPALSAASGS